MLKICALLIGLASIPSGNPPTETETIRFTEMVMTEEISVPKQQKNKSTAKQHRDSRRKNLALFFACIKGKAEKTVAYAYRRNWHQQICKLRDEVCVRIFRRRKDGGVKRQQQVNQHL